MNAVQIVEIIAVSVGLFGLYCLGKYLSDTFFLPREIVTAMTVFDDESRKNADILIHILKKDCGEWRTEECAFSFRNAIPLTASFLI